MQDHNQTESFELKLDAGVFRGLAKANLKFHQCICEFIDNSIAATLGKRFDVTIIFKPNKDNKLIDVYLIDKSGGMDKELLKKAIQIGNSATTEHRLNEHGFGLKNALSTLTNGGKHDWAIFTKTKSADHFLEINSPFDQKMTIKEHKIEPTLPYEVDCPKATTIIFVTVERIFLRTMQYIGKPTSKLDLQVNYLREHLGVFYRGFLSDPKSGGNIRILYGEGEEKYLELSVVPVNINYVVLAPKKVLTMECNNKKINFEVNYGQVRKEDGYNIYYRGDNNRQKGLDIRIGHRVIATGVFDQIWQKVAEGSNDKYVDFVGEVIIPEQDRGTFTTTNHKTDVNLQDQDWAKLFEVIEDSIKIKDLKPSKNWKPVESDVREKMIKSLKESPENSVVDSRKVWGTGVEIDIYYESKNGEIHIYEIKIGKAHPIHLYQLKMYWDGLVIAKKRPTRAILRVEEIGKNIETMLDQMNKGLKDPEGLPYNFVIEKYNIKDYFH